MMTTMTTMITTMMRTIPHLPKVGMTTMTITMTTMTTTTMMALPPRATMMTTTIITTTITTAIHLFAVCVTMGMTTMTITMTTMTTTMMRTIPHLPKAATMMTMTTIMTTITTIQETMTITTIQETMTITTIQETMTITTMTITIMTTTTTMTTMVIRRIRLLSVEISRLILLNSVMTETVSPAMVVPSIAPSKRLSPIPLSVETEQCTWGKSVTMQMGCPATDAPLSASLSAVTAPIPSSSVLLASNANRYCTIRPCHTGVERTAVSSPSTVAMAP